MYMYIQISNIKIHCHQIKNFETVMHFTKDVYAKLFAQTTNQVLSQVQNITDFEHKNYCIKYPEIYH